MDTDVEAEMYTILVLTGLTTVPTPTASRIARRASSGRSRASRRSRRRSCRRLIARSAPDDDIEDPGLAVRPLEWIPNLSYECPAAVIGGYAVGAIVALRFAKAPAAELTAVSEPAR
jgi:hypothetical protein